MAHVHLGALLMSYTSRMRMEPGESRCQRAERCLLNQKQKYGFSDIRKLFRAFIAIFNPLHPEIH